MKKAIAAVGAFALVLLLGACGTDDDLQGVTKLKPEKAEIFINVDGQPDLVRLCIDHEAFVTTGGDNDTVTPVPGWDAWCK